MLIRGCIAGGALRAIRSEVVVEWCNQEAPEHREMRPAKNGNGVVFTKRERDILCLVARGKSYKEIAAALEIGEQTVAKRVGQMLPWLNLRSKNELTAWCHDPINRAMWDGNARDAVNEIRGNYQERFP